MADEAPEEPPPTEFQTALRTGGWVGLTEERLLLAREGERIRVDYDDVAQVTVEDYDYFHAVLSVVLVGFGLWFARRHPAALLFSLAGVATGYRTYRRRDEVQVHVRNRPKPIVFHPVDAGELVGRLAPAVTPEGDAADFHSGSVLSGDSNVK